MRNALKRLAGAIAEFFDPRDWIPTFPIVGKRDRSAEGYQSLWDALRGFPPKDQP